MKRIPWLGLVALATAGLMGLPGLPQRALADTGLEARYRCRHEEQTVPLRAWFFNTTPTAVVLVEGSRALRLPQVVAASGARYSDGSSAFWVKGRRLAGSETSSTPGSAAASIERPGKGSGI